MELTRKVVVVMFTPFHRYLGRSSGPITDEMIDAAVDAGLSEAFDLDWKRDLPPTKNLQSHDFLKDVAAMANSGGGIIVYGVEEKDGNATRRSGVGPFPEAHELTLLRAAVSNISPPIFGIQFYPVGEANNEAVVMVVPPSVDGPHLIYKNEFFGAPIRNGASTTWMREGQIEAAYRTRFDERRHANEVLNRLYDEAVQGRSTIKRAWLFAVAHPRLARVGERLSRDEARAIFNKASTTTLAYSSRGFAHPLETVNWHNPRTGLRRWVATPDNSDINEWRESWIQVHHDGSVSVASAVGGSKNGVESFSAGNVINSGRVESILSDFFALIRAVSVALGIAEYEGKTGIEWGGATSLLFETVDSMGLAYTGASTPLLAYTPVEATISANSSREECHSQARSFVEDFLNQGGIANLRHFTMATD